MQRLKLPLSTVLIFISIFTASCTGVKLSAKPVPEVVKKLDQTNKKTISLEVKSKEDFSSAGHQYLFLFIPFGNIQVEKPEEFIFNKAAEKLAVAGFRVYPEEASNRTALTLELKNLQLTAYDLLFTRKIYCKTEIGSEFNFKNSNKKLIGGGIGEKSIYKGAAFHAQLEYVFEQCLEDAVTRALGNI